MSYRDLREFLQVLEHEGELKRITAPVDPILEIAEITDRVTKAGGPALLFERVKGSSFPALINTFGTERRMNLALGVKSIDELGDILTALLEVKTPESLLDKIRLLPKLKDLASAFPKRVNDGPCKEVIIRDDPRLDIFPVIQCWPKDGGRYITFPLVFTKDPETGIRNVGTYRMQVFDAKTAAMHWHTHKGGAAHYRKYKRLGKRIEVAVALGCDPATTFAATLPLPEGVDELIAAGFLRKSPIELVRCETIDMEVPATAEIILEGYVDPDELRTEGPFGDHTGFYSLADEFPVFHLTCITHRQNPIYQTIIVGKPVQEDCFMGAAIERLFLPLMKKQLPEVVDFHMPFEGVFHNLMIIAIDKQYPGHARKVMHAIWGTGQAMFTKVIVVVDRDVNVRDPKEAWWVALNHIDPERDVRFTMGPIDVLDHSSRAFTYGSKMGIDATKKWKEEGFSRDWPDRIVMDAATKTRVDAMWKELGIAL